MEKLSEILMDKAKKNWADADECSFGSPVWHHATDRAHAFREAAQLAETYEAEVEKRIAELEQRLRTLAEALRELSPGPHHGPMHAEDYVPLVGNRLTALQDWQDSFLEFSKLATPRIAELERQLAWTPVSAGLPTEPGVYEFITLTRKCALFDLDAGGQWWSHGRGEGTAPENLLDETYWQSFRRIELPEEK
jgi:hypothetical protein